VNSVTYTEDIQDMILSYLDGWAIYSPTPAPTPVENNENEQVETETTESNTIQPFITNIEEYKDNPNKRITSKELEDFFNSSYNKSLMYCNRMNIDDLTESEAEFYIQGVCMLAASDIWNKYNIRVNNEDMEDTYIQSYGGLLYKQAIDILKGFINQRITGLSSFRENRNNNNSNVWII